MIRVGGGEPCKHGVVITQAVCYLCLIEEDRDRLKRGEFTAEEIHDICHNLHGKVDARGFADGCAAEQRRLYGCAPDADQVTSLIAAREALRDELVAVRNLQHEWVGRAEVAEAQLAALTDQIRAIRAYVQHKPGCHVLCRFPPQLTLRRCANGNLGCDIAHGPCTCGLDRLTSLLNDV